MATRRTPRAPAEVKSKLEAEGFDKVLSRIEGGESMSEIAGTLDVAVSVLWRWLRSTEERSARVDEAQRESAAGWLDRGLRTLERASTASKAGVQKARAIEQHCARRAAILNPKFRDNVAVEATVKGSLSVVVQAAGPKDEEL